MPAAVSERKSGWLTLNWSRLCIDMGIDMCMDTCIDMGIYMCIDMGIYAKSVKDVQTTSIIP